MDELTLELKLLVVKCALRSFKFDKNENVKQHLNERFYKLNYLIFLIKKMWCERNHLHGYIYISHMISERKMITGLN
jgi:hypothetical protein